MEGSLCCSMWRSATCVIDDLEDPIRRVTVREEQAHVRSAGCSDLYVYFMGGAMPLPCYWIYRKWAVVLMAAGGFVALFAPILACILMRRRRRRQHRVLLSNRRW